jgi:predicted P-loop ATPase
VALIARAIKPGAQVDTVWCFEGPQGTFKSKSLRELGGPFHAEISAAIGTTDFQRELRGLWIAELSELDSLRGREASTVKRLLSAPADRFVQKYALHAESYPRRAVAVASTNEASYWEDPTGARRLIPIPCGEIRVDLIATNRLQWFAEARQLHAAGATWWEFPAAIVAAQEDRQQVDPWEDLLQDRIAHGRKVGVDGMGRDPWPDGWISTADIMRDWLGLDAHQQGKASGVRLGKVMRRLGYRPERHGKGRERGWIADTQSDKPGEVSA